MNSQINFDYENKTYPFAATEGRTLKPLPHLHEHVELVLMMEGDTIAVADGQSVTLEAGDLFIAFPYQVHYYLNDPEIPRRRIVVVIHPQLCPEFTEQLRSFTPISPVLHRAAEDPVIAAAFRALVSLHAGEQDAFTDIQKRGYILVLLGQICHRLPLEERMRRDDDPLRAVLLYCDEHYAEDITLPRIASALGVHPCTVSRLLSARLHMSLREYINSLRVQRACALLRDTPQTVTDVAFATGYNSLRSFNRCFKQITGRTPREYRAAMR